MQLHKIIYRVNVPLLLAVLGILLFLLFNGSCFTPAQNGGDEGFELCKAFQMNGPDAWHKKLWNDQPLLLDELYRLAFRLMGTHAWSARLVNLGFLGIILISLGSMIPKSTPFRWIGIAAVWSVLLSHTITYELSISAMKELPAFALAVLSLAVITTQIPKQNSSKHLFISGCIFAFAVQIKYTALLVLPTIICSILINTLYKKRFNKETMKLLLHTFKIWSATFLLTSIVLLICFWLLHPDWSWAECLRSHFGKCLPEYVAEKSGYQYSWSRLLDGYWFYPLLLLGIWISFQSSKYYRCKLLPSLLFILIICGVHLFHRPFWGYYILHFVAAFALLTATVMEPVLKKFSALQKQKDGGTGILFAATLAFATLFISGAFSGIQENLAFLSQFKNRNESPLVNAMRKYAANTKWIYTRENFLAFQAQLPIPPNLVLLVKKRFWNGQINSQEILKEINQIEPEQLLLKQEELQQPKWKEWVETNYVKITSYGGLVLYVHKRLQPISIPKDKQIQLLLKNFGLEQKDEDFENNQKQ